MNVDVLELRALRDGARRAIAWELFEAEALSEAQRHRLGRAWRARMEQEHLAIGAFARLTLELAEAGADPVVLALTARASMDEVRHAEICRRIAVACLPTSDVPARLRGVPTTGADTSRPIAERALLHVVEMCCLNETCTGVYLTEMLERATNPSARSAIESLLEDEVDHGRVGWAHLEGACREGWGQSVVEPALPGMIARALGEVIDAASRSKPEPDAPTTHGYLSLHDAGDVYRRTLRDVILPGLQTVGFDIAPLSTTARAHNWLP